MSISLGELAQPLTEARDKLKADAGSAGALQDALSATASSLGSYSQDHQRDVAQVSSAWQGDRADTFTGQAEPVTAALDGASNWAASTARTIGDAVGLVRAAEAEAEALISEFAADAGPLIAIANSATAQDKGVAVQAQAVLQGMAARYAAAAAQVVAGAKGQLAQTAGKISSSTSASAPPDSGGPIGHHHGGHSGGGHSGVHSGGGRRRVGGAAVITPPSSQFGSGTQVNLPDGMGTVNAPNERAAIAMRAALGQLGVPYQWGGTHPGQGLDCSGLTQYAYGQAGIGLPHYSGSQTVGRKIDQAQLQPGDLVVWKGHVAMCLGDGKMIEEPHTGAVCHIVPLRTSNAGDTFKGFYRPSA